MNSRLNRRLFAAIEPPRWGIIAPLLGVREIGGRPKILWMSEAFHHGVFPSVAGGFPSEWVEVMKKAEKMDVRIFAPAHGFVDSPAVLKEEELNYRHALEALIAEGKRLKQAGVPVEDAPKQANLGPYASMFRYAENLPGALTRVYLELDGKLPPRPGY